MSIKVRFENLTVEDVKSKNTDLDDPLLNFPLLQFIRFSIETLKHLFATDNGCRGVKQEKGNVHALNASFASGGWAVKEWPFPFIVIEKTFKKLIDRRHSHAAAHQLAIQKVPGAEYQLVKGHKYSSLKLESIITLAGVYINATDGTTNAVKDHFVFACVRVCEENHLDYTNIKIVKELLDLMGVHQRYNYAGAITSIETKILNWGDEPTRLTENATDNELEEYLKQDNCIFADNKTDKDGTKLLVMTADTNFNKRYAWDLLRHLWEAEAGGYNIRILVQSKKSTALGVKTDRDDLICKAVQYCDLAYDSYKSHAEEVINNKFKNIFPDWSIDFPLKGVHSLTGEVYLLHQLEGEDEPLQIDFTEYMETFDPLDL
tara:strand:+ start:717 stop:1841 length:1125 start_codon:yes stop_codon:yes gene_type:complete